MSGGDALDQKPNLKEEEVIISQRGREREREWKRGMRMKKIVLDPTKIREG